MNQLSIDFTAPPVMPPPPPSGRDLGHAAANDAARHADRVSPEWSDRALEILRRYCERHADVMAEDVRQYANTQGLERPPETRAWGAVMLRGKAAGYIRHAGFTTAKDPKVHSNPVGIWRSLICRHGGTTS
jgi:hypothetical protein